MVHKEATPPGFGQERLSSDQKYFNNRSIALRTKLV